MFKACSRCGKVHDTNYNCTYNKPKYDYSKYGTYEERKFRNTKAWQNKRELIKKQAQYLCEVCRDKGVYNYNSLEIHHIIKIREDRSKQLDSENLICLCAKHHKQADSGALSKSYLIELAKRRNEKPSGNIR